MPQHSLTVACSMARGQAPRGVPSRLYGRPGGRHLEIGALPGSSWEEGVLKDTASTRRGWRERGCILLSQHSLRLLRLGRG